MKNDGDKWLYKVLFFFFLTVVMTINYDIDAD